MTGREGLQHVVAAWDALKWRHVGLSLLVGTLFFLTNLRFFIYVDLSWPIVAGFILRHIIVGLILTLAIVAADRLVDRGTPLWRTYAAAVTIAALLSDPIALHLSAILHWRATELERSWWSLNGAVGIMIKAGLGTAAYVRWREAQMMSEALRRSRLRRADDARRLQETRLQALQARVDPQFLFDVLRQIAALQQKDPTSADALLDQLITLLRELMPHERADASTVAREIALGVSYLRIVAAATCALTIEVSLEPGAADARLSPMLLIPLMSAILTARTGGMPRLTLRAYRSADLVRIHLTASPEVNTSILNSSELDRVRTHLHDLHGDKAGLRVQMSEAFSATIEIPREFASRAAASQAAPP